MNEAFGPLSLAAKDLISWYCLLICCTLNHLTNLLLGMMRVGRLKPMRTVYRTNFQARRMSDCWMTTDSKTYNGSIAVLTLMTAIVQATGSGTPNVKLMKPFTLFDFANMTQAKPLSRG